MRLGEPRTGVNTVTFGFGNFPTGGVPFIVSQFKFRSNRAGGNDAPVAVIAGDIKFFAVPDAKSAAAAAFADAVIVHLLAVVLVVMLGGIHHVHDEAAILFDPHIRAAGDGAFALDERLAVSAMRDAVAFPCEIVHALRHITRERLHDGRRHNCCQNSEV